MFDSFLWPKFWGRPPSHDDLRSDLDWVIPKTFKILQQSNKCMLTNIAWFLEVDMGYEFKICYKPYHSLKFFVNSYSRGFFVVQMRILVHVVFFYIN